MDEHEMVGYIHFAMRSRTMALLFLLCSLVYLSGMAEGSSVPAHLEGALDRLLDLGGSTVWAQEHGIELDPSGRFVRVVMESGTNPASRVDEQEMQGGTIEARSEHLVRARLPLQHLREIAELPGISFIRRPYTMRLLGAPYTTGALPTGAILFHSFGFRGQGVKIAVIDAGFLDLDRAIHSGLISSHVIIQRIDYTGEGFEGDTVHGTQVVRIVNEMAPEALLILMKVADEVDLENAVADAIRLNVQIISHSIGWFDSNFGDGRGLIDEIAQQALEAGILWVNAAGNQAQQHWTGLFRDDNKNRWAEFEGEQESLAVWAGLGGIMDLVLVWDDWPRTDQDYDLFLLNAQGEVVTSSESSQLGSEPRETLEYLVTEPGVYQLKVKARRSTRPMRLKIFSITSGQTLTPNTPHGSVVAPADCSCVLAVGAASVYQWDEGVVEPFSALGPTSDGRIKPDLVGPDGVRKFFGTSAAAPHVAGAAALLLSQHPDWDVHELWAALEEDAVDLDPPGLDVASGAGRLQLVLGDPQAIRSLPTPEVAAGGSLLVKISVRMPADFFGSLTLREQLPAGFSLEPIEGSKAHFAMSEGMSEGRWTWLLLGPGEAREVVYRLLVSHGVKPGRYRLTGSLNGAPIEGEEWLEILPSKESSANLAVSARVTRREIVFQVEKAPLPASASWQVRIFDLMGQERWDSGWVSRERLAIELERRWANGVYLYVITVRDPVDPRSRSEIQKLLILR